MSQFIVPISSLPSITSVADKNVAGSVSGEASIPFDNLLTDALNNAMQAQESSSAAAYDLAVGGSDDLHTGAVEALKYSTAISYATGIASSAIQAYNELIRMQI